MMNKTPLNAAQLAARAGGKRIEPKMGASA